MVERGRMRVPLQMQPYHTGSETLLEIYHNGNRHIVTPPTLPYLYSFNPEHPGAVISEPFEKTLLSNHKKAQVYRHYYQATKDIKENRTEDTFEDHIQFHHRCLIDFPEFILSYANTHPLKKLDFDVEQDSTPGAFPNAQENPVIAIGHAINDGLVQKKLTKGLDDRILLRTFMASIEDEDPDVIVTYNGNFYDVPLIMERCEIHGIDTSPFTRYGEISINTKGRYTSINCSGRVFFDVYLHVLHDQTIYGIKNKKMKTVAEWMKIEPIIKEDTNNMRALVATPKLATYVGNDVHLTRELAKVYMPICEQLAEVLRLPFDMAANYSQFMIGTIVQGRAIHHAGFVADGNNYQRNTEIFDSIPPGKKLHAAEPRIYQEKTLFKKTYRIDFKSMYPTIYATFNISPETVELLRIDPYQDEYKIERKDEFLICYIPDVNLGVRFVIKIDLSTEGYIPQTNKKILKRRYELKKQWQDADSKERPRLHALQNALKIVPNAINGYNGSPAAPFGNILCYILCTGIGRYLCEGVRADVIDFLIEEDTDGFYISEPVSVEHMNADLDQWVETQFGLKNYLGLEIDNLGASYFYVCKNYIFIDEKGEFKVKGAALKGSHKPPLADKVIERVGKAMLLDPPMLRDIVNQVRSLSNYELSDFTLSTHFRKAPDSYGEGSMQATLIQQYIEVYGKEPELNQQIYYVKTITGYVLLSNLASRAYIDTTYYSRIIDDILENLDVENILNPQSSIDKYF